MAPWQNGRIERFFGTFKQCWRRFQPDGSVEQVDLDIFRGWYNHVRPHQHLDGRTPAEAWDPATRRRREPIFVSAWDEVLAGFLW